MSATTTLRKALGEWCCKSTDPTGSKGFRTRSSRGHGWCEVEINALDAKTGPVSPVSDDGQAKNEPAAAALSTANSPAARAFHRSASEQRAGDDHASRRSAGRQHRDWRRGSI